ncbi:hypothetical protein AB1Y20_001200 [Prymnesium parvum]|uniref:Zeta toxin domain-containing protein n=1 Tax=Prymnesium parvum TaxID=97485 RepID=A0AB34KCP7_PRYPA
MALLCLAASANLFASTPPSARTYDFSRTTSENYAQPDAPLSREFFTSRAGLDYNWHVRYSLARQHVQDAIIREMLAPAQRAEPHGKKEALPWVLLTAGCMGSGKTHVMTLLDRHELISLHRFVRIDMDRIRAELPETSTYMRIDKRIVGSMTQLEAGAIAEIASEEALSRKLSVWIDSTLQDAEWWELEFRRIKRTYPHRLAIVHVTASWPKVQEREAKRGLVTGRRIPINVLRTVFTKVPDSIKKLKPLVDEYIEVDNENTQPRLKHASDVRALLRVAMDVADCPTNKGAVKENARRFECLEMWLPNVRGLPMAFAHMRRRLRDKGE